MARVNLTARLELIGRTVEGTGPAIACANAMHDEMLSATARYLGPDLRMHNFPGAPVAFKVLAQPGRAEVTLSGGTYALANRGRRRKRRRIYAEPRKRKGQRRSALEVPGTGYRRLVKGSKWSGFNITERHAPDAIRLGMQAALDVIHKRKVSA